MFERPHHRRIARVLSALNGDLLRETQCLFGGGTEIALRFGASIWICRTYLHMQNNRNHR